MISTHNMFLEKSVPECNKCNLDTVFKRFKSIEFPTSFVGLSTIKTLDVEIDLSVSAYLKTMYNNKLMKFADAREISASHRAFNICLMDDHTLAITFMPTSECISKVKHDKHFENRFVFDLRLIQVDGKRCCNNELHSEVGRYYISGEFEYCNLSHDPDVVNFGDVSVSAKISKHVRIRNESNVTTAKITYIRSTGFEVEPQSFTIPPNSSRRITIVLKPTCLLLQNKLTFQVRNCHSSYKMEDGQDNFLTYMIAIGAKVTYNNISKDVTVESLHKLIEKNPKYTYLNEELQTHMKRKERAQTYLTMSKNARSIKPVVKKISTVKDNCANLNTVQLEKPGSDFCKHILKKIPTFELFDILFSPFTIEFGRVGINTYGDKELSVKNNSNYDIILKLLKDACILYTEDKLEKLSLKLKSKTEVKITIFCLGMFEGNYYGTFEYTIDNKYYRKHPYFLQVGNPTLMVSDKCLRFGMVTSESFVTSVPVKIFNNFNVDTTFEWNELHVDAPFKIIPINGIIPKHSCRICDVLYNSKPTKSKTHEVDLVTGTKMKKIIPLELSVITRKLSIKFLQSAIIFKDIALNIETIERVKLENSSREIALFYVVEPLIPGFRIEPMTGTIRPKMVISFKIIVKISCILEFAFDIYVKINNKENLILPVSGNVVEPKLVIHPKNIYMPRVPCNMITFIPVTFQNTSTLKIFIEVLDTGDDNIFNVYIAQGNEKQRVFKFEIEGGQSKTVFVKVYDIFRREYEMYIPFKINGLLGPPNSDSSSTEIQSYIGEYERTYDNNPKVKLKTVTKDIAYCRITGVITVPWIEFSEENFEIDLKTNTSSTINFSVKNVSKYYLHVAILTSKLAPNFSLDLQIEENCSLISESSIRLELDRQQEVSFTLKFHPKGHGKFVTTALLYLDKHMTIPYYNLTFTGKRQTPALTPSTYRIVFPPCHIGNELSQSITLIFEDTSDEECFSCMVKDEPKLTAKFVKFKSFENERKLQTEVTVEVKVCCETTYSRNLIIAFNHSCGSGCEIEVSFCFTYCQLTLHASSIVQPQENPYPYFPLESQTKFYDYLEVSSKFLEKWMFQQGFRRDLYPIIPDTFHAISTAISSPSSATKGKGINVSYLNFVKRIAGPLMKHIRKTIAHEVDESFKCVKEIHDTYREIINLLRSRGADLWDLQGKFLLSYDQFAIYTENVTPKCNADIILNKELLADVNLYNRLNKQSWIDFILQSYKVFIMDSCFFECVCVSSQSRDIIKILIDWYNEQIASQHYQLRGHSKPRKFINNITTDLSDGMAIASAILNYCSFFSSLFSTFCEVNENDRVSGIINNACLIIEAMNTMRLYFPLQSIDFLQPNFIQMLFLSIHLYVVLPMFKPKDIIKFNPPLLRSSTRHLVISTATQESVIFNFIILNNLRNSFTVEKAPAGDNGKKLLLNIKFLANYTTEETCILLVHGYNKTRIFDTYMIFLLKGYIGSLNPVKKCKVTGPLFRPNKVDVLVSSPFLLPATYRLFLTDNEPTIPVNLEDDHGPRFYIRRLNLIDKEINLCGLPKESGQDIIEHKIYLQIICLSTQIGNSWIWFKGEIGEFFIKVTSQPRWDLAIDTLQARVRSWPLDPCSCGETCECYRTTVLVIPHCNELMLKSLRYALLEHASDIMLQVYDRLIGTPTGKIILGMLLAEGGTNMTEIQHILQSETVYRISSRALLPRMERVRLAQHSDEVLALPIMVPTDDKSEKYSVTFTSACGMDIRTYRVIFVETSDGD
ncbi:hypothetical protein evm_004875 [Chilo suppressalis]|nr:hypothetical protein evm_004875 [Chilo suppressalis]